MSMGSATSTAKSSNNDKEPAFELVRTREIPSLQLEVEEYVHLKTGAQHFHFATEQLENVFMVTFRTVPEDSTGVAHILEHTTLCGSERFPVRDPFFLMIRRSLNTFMNAFTASDYTSYPFATENRRDFQNLLEIYLDAVFFPLLDPLDFAQEGHRLEFAETDNSDSDLQLKGIVYNEMKGDQSSIVSLLYETIKSELFPSGTYHFNSGGDPKQIPNLSYDQLREFHQRHYHPSNAIFMTSGNMSATDHQHQFEDLALSRFSRASETIAVGVVPCFDETKRTRHPYPVSADGTDKRSHVVMGWKLGLNTNLEELIKCNLLSDVLLDTSASPLRLALENTPLGIAPSPLCGLEESNLELSFYCGLEGVREENSNKIEALILETLGRVEEQGVDPERIEACLHQLELSHREIGGDGYPFGLQLMFSCLSAAVHRSDPIGLLDLDQVIDKIRSEIQEPDFIPGLIRTYLLNNAHRVLVTLFPDEGFAEREQDELTQELNRKLSSFSEQDKQYLIEQSRALEERQARAEPMHLLPKVGLEEIGQPRQAPSCVDSHLEGVSLSEYQAGTNGLCYQQVYCDLPGLSQIQQQLLQVYSQLVTEVGAGDRDYLQTQEKQHAKTGGIGCYSSLRGDAADPNRFAAKFAMSSRCLIKNLEDMNEILLATFSSPQFSERNRVSDLIHQLRVRRDSGIQNNGHGMAMTAAGAWFRPVPRFNHGIGGLQGILQLRELDSSISEAAGLDSLLEELLHIATQLGLQHKSMVLISSEIGLGQKLMSSWGAIAGLQQSMLTPDSKPVNQYQAWRTTTQVNHCAEVFPTVAEHHDDAAALAVLAGVLRNGFLHGAIREQGGAYGGGASHDQANGLFRFYSYRDPNVEATFDAFKESLNWLQKASLGEDLVEEAILGIVSGMDAPGSPAGEAKQHFQQHLFGRHFEHRAAFRERIIQTKQDDIKRVAFEYLGDNSRDKSARAVITNHQQSLDSAFESQRV